ncbi:MAG: hypothetical protein K2H88_08885, partial [Duncaniella sp.]|nr:hypothetical protein [Duncaniella sp.]
MKMTNLLITLSLLTAWACGNASVETVPSAEAIGQQDNEKTLAIVKPGIEALRDGGFAELKGKRVGLITNPTGIDNSMVSTID